MTRRFLIGATLLAALGIVATSVAATRGLVELRGVLAPLASAAMGRAVVIHGTARLRSALPLALHVEGLEVGGPAETSWLRAARIGSMDLVLAPGPLTRRELRVERVALADGEVSLEAPDAEAAEAQQASPWQFQVQHARADDVAVELRLAGGGHAPSARIERLELQPANQGSTIEIDGDLGGARIRGRGSLLDVDGGRSASLRLQLDAPDLAVFAEVAKRELPELGPVHGQAVVELEGDRLGVTELDLHVGNEDAAWLHLTGEVKDLSRRRGFALLAEFGFQDVRALAPLVRNPPHIGAVEGRARISDHDETPGVDEFWLKGGRRGVFEIDAEGRFEDIQGVHGLDARVDLKARDLAVIGELLRRELPAVGPVEFSGKVSAHAGVLDTQYVRARIDRTHFNGALSGRFASDRRPRLTAHVDVPDLHLDDVGLSPSEHGAVATPGAEAAPARVFSDAPFDLDWLNVADVQASVHVDRMLGVRGPLLRDVQLDVSLKDGWLSSRHRAHTMRGGVHQSQLDFDARVSPPTLDLDAHFKGLDLGGIVAQIDVHGAYSGEVDARFDLHSRGVSGHEIAAHLGGEATLSAGQGTIATAHARLLTRDLIQAMRRIAERGASPEEKLNCLIADFELREGVAEVRTLVLDTRDVVVVGEGGIDFGAETVQLRLLPRPHRASLLSTAVTVQVTGSLRQPTVKTEKGSLVKSSTKALLKSVSGATRLRQSWRWLRGRKAKPTLCESLLGP